MVTVKQLLRMRLAKDKRMANVLYKELKPYRGMTMTQAKKHGWGAKQQAQQAMLWNLGYDTLRTERILKDYKKK
jgi:hypothetical protein